MKNKLISVIVSALVFTALAVCLTACAAQKPTATPGTQTTAPAVTTDRLGNAITLPSTVERIVSIGTATTENLLGLGLADKLIGVDSYSTGYEDLRSDVVVFDMLHPDVERLLALKPDIIFISTMSLVNGVDPLKPVSDMGACVVYVPVSESIQAIKDDILFLGAVTKTEETAGQIVAVMEREISSAKQFGKSITERKRVYFEVDSEGALYTFGSDVFLNDILELIGAENIFAEQNAWISTSAEAVLKANPDVILTNVKYKPDPIGDIKSRPGWDATTAVKNGRVFYIDGMASSLPTYKVITILKEMANAVYPERFPDK